jgi:hypothetical protein
MKMAVDDRETIVGRATCWQNWYYLQQAFFALCLLDEIQTK